jgi:1-deoxy-D-xylulose-5-phosphate synthase
MKDSNKCIDVHQQSEGSLSGAPIVLRKCDHDETEQWIFDWKFEGPKSSSQHIPSSLHHVLFNSISMAAIGALSLSVWLWRWQAKVAAGTASRGGMSLQKDAGGVSLGAPLASPHGLHEFPHQCASYHRRGRSPTMSIDGTDQQSEMEIVEVGNASDSGVSTLTESPSFAVMFLNKHMDVSMYLDTPVEELPVTRSDENPLKTDAAEDDDFVQLSRKFSASVMYRNGRTRQSNEVALGADQFQFGSQTGRYSPEGPWPEDQDNGVGIVVPGTRSQIVVEPLGPLRGDYQRGSVQKQSGNVVRLDAKASAEQQPFKEAAEAAARQSFKEAASPKEGVPPVPKRGTFPYKPTPLLDSLNDEGTEKIRGMSIPQLVQLSEEVRWQVLDAVSVTGGHLGSALGVVELTVALHHVFDTPNDDLVWDVAHQVYPHKVLTGRRDRIYTLRQGGGLSGFAKRSESEYDAFGAGHSSTSISAAVGMQAAREATNQPGHAVAIIGDGAITGGMAWEAMNHAGDLGSKIIVILNDNGQVSLPTFYNKVDKPVGALSQTLAKSDLDLKQSVLSQVEGSSPAQSLRQVVKEASKAFLPEQLAKAAAEVEEFAQDRVYDAVLHNSGDEHKGEIFEQLGFSYFGPIDGHDMKTLTMDLANLKRQHAIGQIDKPILLHIKTQKGRGYSPAETARDKLHAVSPKFNLPKPEKKSTDGKAKKASSLCSFTSVFGKSLVREGKRDASIAAITAAMPGGTGVSIFEEQFPSRTYDVGIAEQHAVTFAAGLATGGLKPFCCIYSTFLQRGYDQVVHDVALQNLPVRFVLDRAGLVGADGPTHYGSFDLSYLACIPNMKICAPSDEVELSNMVHTMAMLDDGPVALRYPRGSIYGDVPMPEEPEFLTPGKGRIVRQGTGGTIAILSVGTRLRESLRAAEVMEAMGISATVADARWVKPLDAELVKELCADHRVLITVEENSIGGFSSQVNQVLLENGILDGVGDTPFVLRSMFLPDRYVAHGTQDHQYDDAELNAADITKQSLSALQRAGISHVAKAQSSSVAKV